MAPDLTGLFNLVFQWVLYPVTHWSFTFAGITMSISDFLLGCALLAIVVHVLKLLANDPRIQFIGLIFGGK